MSDPLLLSLAHGGAVCKDLSNLSSPRRVHFLMFDMTPCIYILCDFTFSSCSALYSLPLAIVSTLSVAVVCLHPVLTKKSCSPCFCVVCCVHLLSIARPLIQSTICRLNTKGLPFLTLMCLTFAQSLSCSHKRSASQSSTVSMSDGGNDSFPEAMVPKRLRKADSLVPSTWVIVFTGLWWDHVTSSNCFCLSARTDDGSLSDEDFLVVDDVQVAETSPGKRAWEYLSLMILSPSVSDIWCSFSRQPSEKSLYMSQANAESPRKKHV